LTEPQHLHFAHMPWKGVLQERLQFTVLAACANIVLVYAVFAWQRRTGPGNSSSSNCPACRAAWLKTPPREERARVVLVATGSVASVKVPEITVGLCEFADVVVVFTDRGEAMGCGNAARRYASTWSAEFNQLAASEILHILYDADEWDGYEDVAADAVVHIDLRKWADAIIVAPCSANTLAKVALGLCDNLATCLLRAWDPEKPAVFAPAMNTMMWEHPVTAQHLTTLESWGFKILPPASKRLACGDVGRGALPPVAELLAGVRLAIKGFGERRHRNNSGGSWHHRGFTEWQPAATMRQS